MLDKLFDGNFKAPVEPALEKGMHVLDAGCGIYLAVYSLSAFPKTYWSLLYKGPATWTLEMANAYPQSTFHGIDISPNFPQSIKPANCNFSVHNITERSEFPDNYFGFIHQRLLVAGLLVDDWEKVRWKHAIEKHHHLYLCYICIGDTRTLAHTCTWWMDRIDGSE